MMEYHKLVDWIINGRIFKLKTVKFAITTDMIANLFCIFANGNQTAMAWNTQKTSSSPTGWASCGQIPRRSIWLICSAWAGRAATVSTSAISSCAPETCRLSANEKWSITCSLRTTFNARLFMPHPGLSSCARRKAITE